MSRENNVKVRREFAEYIINSSLIHFLNKNNIEYNVIKVEMIEALENAIKKGDISTTDYLEFIDNEIRYGHHRSYFYVDITSESISHLKNLEKENLIEIIERKGFIVPDQSMMLNVFRPDRLTLVELDYVKSKEINLVFIETIRTLSKNNVKRENNYYFVKIDLVDNILSIRLRPRANVVSGRAENIKKVKNIRLYYRLLEIIKDTFSIEITTPEDLKTTLYKIAKTLTERAEKKWKEEVQKHSEDVVLFANEMKSKLKGFDSKEFDLNFRLHRLLERGLIQSNFEQLKEREEGKVGYINSFHFSDRAGGKVKASSIEKKNAIELSEIYYDTRDTIDKQKKYDLLWVNWFVTGQKSSVETKLEANSEYGLIHFYKYIKGSDLDYVFSQIKNIKKQAIDE